MAQSRYYSSSAQPTVLTGGMTPSQTTAALQQVVGFPTNTPYVLAIGYGTSSEELVLVNTIAGTSLTSITRGFDGTASSSHGAGDAVRHVWCGADGNDARAHEGATANVHGVTGNLVGETSTQTLTNKTLSTPVINTPTVTGGTFSGNPAFSGNPTFSGNPAFSGSPTFSTGTPSFTNGIHAGSTGQFVVSSTGTMTAGTINGNIPFTTSNATAAFTGGLQAGSASQFAVTSTGSFSTTGAFNGASNVNTGAWTNYTPVWIADTGTTTIGNGSISGKWTQVGKLGIYQIKFTYGSTTTQSISGANWNFTLPGNASNTVVVMQPCFGWGLDSSTNTRYIMFGYSDSSATPAAATALTVSGASGFADDSTPFVWASGDRLNITGYYEIA